MVAWMHHPVRAWMCVGVCVCVDVGARRVRVLF